VLLPSLSRCDPRAAKKTKLGRSLLTRSTIIRLVLTCREKPGFKDVLFVLFTEEVVLCISDKYSILSISVLLFMTYVYVYHQLYQ
jgi:hypothetical protein